MKAELAEKLPSTTYLHRSPKSLRLGSQPVVVGAEYYAPLTSLAEEDWWLVFPVLNMTGKRLKSRPDERIACDEHVK